MENYLAIKERKIKEFIGDFDNLFKVTDHNFDTIRTANYFIHIQEPLPNFNKSLKNYRLHMNRFKNSLLRV